MRVKLFLGKSVHENAAQYYDEAKKLRKKAEGLEKAIEETRSALGKGRKKKSPLKVRKKNARRWYEKFHWFFTSGNRLAIGGRDAQQNDAAVSKHMEDGDLFFHADIQGGSAVILKDGKNASEQEMREAAQFAACFSSAWKNGNAAVDVYAVEKSQLSKAAQGGYIPTGAFAIKGKRKWFRGTPLRLAVLKSDDEAVAVPALCGKKGIEVVPSRAGKEKGAIAKTLAKRLDTHPDSLLRALPSGKTKVPKR